MNILIDKLTEEISKDTVQYLRENFDFQTSPCEDGFYMGVDGKSMDDYRFNGIPLENAKIILLSEKVYKQVTSG